MLRRPQSAMNKATTHRFAFAGWLTAVLLLLGCNPQPEVSSDYRSVDATGWDDQRAVVFTTDSLPTSGTYAFTLALRTTTMHPYPYQDITLEVTEHWCLPGHRQRVQRDTLTIALYDNTGAPTVQHGVAYHEYWQPLAVRRLPRATTGTIAVRHLMNAITISGISDIGIITRRE